jgi:hypothetical protein
MATLHARDVADVTCVDGRTARALDPGRDARRLGPPLVEAGAAAEACAASCRADSPGAADERAARRAAAVGVASSVPMVVRYLQLVWLSRKRLVMSLRHWHEERALTTRSCCNFNRRRLQPFASSHERAAGRCAAAAVGTHATWIPQWSERLLNCPRMSVRDARPARSIEILRIQYG